MAQHGFCFTLNNYSPAQELTLCGAIGHCGITYFVNGHKVGEQGTPHLQGFCKAIRKANLIFTASSVSLLFHNVRLLARQ
jgi:hypothetical protein